MVAMQVVERIISWWQDIDVEGLGAHFYQNFAKLEGIIKTG